MKMVVITVIKIIAILQEGTMKSFMYLSLACLLVLTSSMPVLAGDIFSCVDVTEIPLIECEVLVTLYNSTN